MKLRGIIAALGAGLLVLGSCNGPEPEEPVLPAALTAPVLQLEPASGSVFLSVTASKAWTISVAGGSWATVSPASGTGSRNSVILSYEANTGEDARSVTLTLNATPGGQATLTLTQKAVVKPVGPDQPQQYGYGYDVAAPHWLELPATDNPDLYFITHFCNYAGAEQRNYSFYWDTAALVVHWVAYPLNRGLIGSGSRSDAWGYDPLLPYAVQQNIITSAYGTGHSRGHQIPSADRLDRAANVSTFYATNMTPQEPDFNGGVWEKLESKVRTYAKACDTLYVVTGCVVKSTSTSIPDKMNHKVKLPEAYYKALLRYEKGSEYIACGFYIPHDSSIPAETFMDYIMSIDELEKKTGMDFFVNLPDAIGADKARAVETQAPGSWWK